MSIGTRSRKIKQKQSRKISLHRPVPCLNLASSAATSSRVGGLTSRGWVAMHLGGLFAMWSNNGELNVENLKNKNNIENQFKVQ